MVSDKYMAARQRAERHGWKVYNTRSGRSAMAITRRGTTFVILVWLDGSVEAVS